MAKVKYTKVMKCDDLEIGKSAIIEVGDKEIALFNYKGDFTLSIIPVHTEVRRWVRGELRRVF